jgi:hypothetical protein
MNKHVNRREKRLIGSVCADTEFALKKMLSGDIPAATLQYMELDWRIVSDVIAKELLLLHYAAEGAKMSLVSLLLYETHVALIDKAQSKHT